MGIKIIDTNKKAFFDYFVLETVEAGIVLTGAEVKSVKLGHAALRDSFCQLDAGELWLKNCNITPYVKGSAFNEEARRNRKLLLHRAEINKIAGKSQTKGYTLIPTKLYFSGNRVKVEIGLCKGKQLHDKRDTLRDKDIQRDTDREIKNYK